MHIRGRWSSYFLSEKLVLILKNFRWLQILLSGRKEIIPLKKANFFDEEISNDFSVTVILPGKSQKLILFKKKWKNVVRRDFRADSRWINYFWHVSFCNHEFFQSRHFEFTFRHLIIMLTIEIFTLLQWPQVPNTLPKVENDRFFQNLYLKLNSLTDLWSSFLW